MEEGVVVRKDPLTDLVTVRDADGNEASFFYQEWEDFIESAKHGAFDLDKVVEVRD